MKLEKKRNTERIHIKLNRRKFFIIMLLFYVGYNFMKETYFTEDILFFIHNTFIYLDVYMILREL